MLPKNKESLFSFKLQKKNISLSPQHNSLEKSGVCLGQNSLLNSKALFYILRVKFGDLSLEFYSIEKAGCDEGTNPIPEEGKN